MATFTPDQITSYASIFIDNCSETGIVDDIASGQLKVVMEPYDRPNKLPALVFVKHFTHPEQVCGLITTVRQTNKQFETNK